MRGDVFQASQWHGPQRDDDQWVDDLQPPCQPSRTPTNLGSLRATISPTLIGGMTEHGMGAVDGFQRDTGDSEQMLDVLSSPISVERHASPNRPVTSKCFPDQQDLCWYRPVAHA